MRRKIYYWTKKYVTQESLRNLIILIFAITCLFLNKETLNIKKVLSDAADSSVFLTIILLVITTLLFQIISNIVLKYSEDDAKIYSDSKEIMKKYPLANALTVEVENEKNKYPMEELWASYNDSNPIFEVIDDENSFYQPPEQISKHFDEIYQAHAKSLVYNKINIRLKDLVKEDNKIKLYTERVKFYDTLVTNRAMDLKWGNGYTVRELYEPGPFFTPLKESKLANHWGGNGLVESNDGFFALTKNPITVSIEKNMYNFAVTGPLKVEDAINKKTHRIDSMDDICRALKIKVVKDLNLVPDEQIDGFLEHIVLTQRNLLGIYRDMAEGGKPHYLYYVKIPFSASEVDALYGKKEKNANDPKKISWISKDAFKNGKPYNKGIVYGGKKYKMVDSTIGLLLKCEEIIRKNINE
jgi:hypothetical protein